MADFDLTQTDAQVQSILNDAQNAQGAGAQTTLTTDYIMLKDTSGNYHKILKDSFTEACRNVLAGLLVNNDKGTTISQLPAIASGDFGSVTPANLASVLGGYISGMPSKMVEANTDLNTILPDQVRGLTFYDVQITTTPQTVNAPIAGRLFIVAFGMSMNNYVTQLCIAVGTNNIGHLYVRFTGNAEQTWGIWYEIPLTAIS